MNSQLKNVIIDGLLLLCASTVLAIITDQFFGLFKDKSLDGNPLVSTIATAASNDRVEKDRLKKKNGDEAATGDDLQKIESHAKKVLETNLKLEKFFNPGKGEENYLQFRDNHGCTALMMVCYVNLNGITEDPDPTLKSMESDEDRLPYVSQLIAEGMDVNATDKDGWTALAWTAWSGLPRICERLIEAGADVNIRDKKNNSLLTIAAIRGNHEVIALLLGKGVNPDLKTDGGENALSLAKRELERRSQFSFMQIVPRMETHKEIYIKRYEQTVQLLENGTNPEDVQPRPELPDVAVQR